MRRPDFSRRKSNRFRSVPIEALEDRLLLTANIEFRTFDGSGNNVENPHWGTTDSMLLRLTTVEYGDGAPQTDPDIVFPGMAVRVDSDGNVINPRTVSNLVFDQDFSILNDRGLTSFTFQWGQFLDHDMDLTEAFVGTGTSIPGEGISFFVTDPDDELFIDWDDEIPKIAIIPMLRSRFMMDENNTAQQINQITSYLDGSNIYGSTDEKAEALRSHFGGFLLTSDGVTNIPDGSGQFLPFNYEFNGEFIENASPPTTGNDVPLSPDDLFVAGDVRSNEQPGLTAMHTLFVREHNYQARRIADELNLDADDLANPEVDEYVYQLARAIVGAEIQSITYNEFLPALFGPDQLDSYEGYKEDVNASIANIFSGALYRIGHTMLPNELLLLNNDGTPVPDDLDVNGSQVIDGQVSLGDAFFNPALITEFGIEPYLKGLSVQQIQEIDNFIVDGVRNLLFDPPAGTDLGATNLQRGRDHGLADYNQVREDFGLEGVASFSDITSNNSLAAALAQAYDGDVNNIDVFAGAISEDQLRGSSVGELMHTVLLDQFRRLRDGDRFYFENVFHGRQLDEIQNTQLSDIIRRNTGLDTVQEEIFRGENVFTYRAEEGNRGIDITLRVRGDELQVVEGRNRIVARQDLADTEIVALFGTTRLDRIEIDASVAKAFSGSIEVHGNGGIDFLVVEGTNNADDIEVTASEVRVNELSVFYGNFEFVTVDAGNGNDNAIVIEEVETVLTIDGGNGNDTLEGGAGTEILLGGNGNDLLLGGAGHDVLSGGNGKDTLIGGAGLDLLLGGNGRDTEIQGTADPEDNKPSQGKSKDRGPASKGGNDSLWNNGLDLLFSGLDFDWDWLDTRR